MNKLISTKNLTKNYSGICRVNNINLDVNEGEIYGFLGPNGAGKTTTLKMLIGLTKPSKGSVTIFNKNLHKNRKEILSNVGSLIESPSYYGHLTGYENLKIIQTLRNAPKQNINKVLQIVRLDNQKNRLVKNYSLGMKQRLGIAIALVTFPKLLILDEPTNGLDPNGIREIRELILSLPKQYGITTIISTHILSEIEQIADSLGIIDLGKLLYQGTLKNLEATNSSEFYIRTHNNHRAHDLLLKKGFASQLRDNELIFNQLSDSDISYLNRFLISEEIDVLRIEEKRQKLEDIFLELTGRERAL